MCYKNDAIIYDPVFHKLIEKAPFHYIDIGARGELGEPWKSLFGSGLPMKVIGFEPDPKACKALNAKAGEREIFLPTALWNKKGKISIYLNDARSSVHQPDMNVLKRYAKPHWEGRTSKKTVKVEADTLDSVLKEHKLTADFIKCDTQGSEYEILEGAIKILKNQAFGVIAETWTIPAHKGQHLHHEIEALMNKINLPTILREPHGTWHYALPNNLEARGETVQFNTLFFKTPGMISKTKIYKAAAIADLFGFTHIALELLSAKDKETQWMREEIIKRRSQKRLLPSPLHNLAEKALRRIGINIAHYPPLAG